MNARYTWKDGNSSTHPQSRKRWTRRHILSILVLMAVLAAAGIGGCAGWQRAAPSTQETGVESSVGESREGGSESGGEHGSGGESGSEGSGGSEEGSANLLTLDQTFDQVRLGAQLIMAYDAASNAFVGTVANTTNGTLTRVRVEIHLSNGVELGPTAPVDLAPGQVIDIVLPASGQFDGWVPHAEVGSGEGAGSESGSEGGSEGAGGEGHGPGGEGANEAAMEAAMSSPIIPLDQSWNGVLGGLAVSARYDTATQTVHSTVRNTTQQQLCYVQAEPHLKLGSATVGELGPDPLGDLNPGQEATSSLGVASEPSLAGVSFDGYVIHMEVFDCSGPGPVAHTGAEGAEGGSGESGSEGGEGSAGGSEEGSANLLTLDQTFDQVPLGARLIMAYQPADNTFVGTVANTTNGTLTRVRVEIHLSNGVELGPTTPVDLAPGQVIDIVLPASGQFDGWVPHAEVGSGEGGDRESGGEHGSGGESGGEHGSGDRG